MVAVEPVVGVLGDDLLEVFFGDSEPHEGVVAATAIKREDAVLAVVFLEEGVEGAEVDLAGGDGFFGDGFAVAESVFVIHFVEVLHCVGPFEMVVINCVLVKVCLNFGCGFLGCGLDDSGVEALFVDAVDGLAADVVLLGEF